MTSLLSLLAVLAAAILAYRQAKQQGQWSWRAAGLITLLVAVYAIGAAGIGVGIASWVAPQDPAWAVLIVLVPIIVGIVPTAILAKRIQRRYAPRTTP
ncbi:hypothetical protein [Prosthecomicrobium sp. N25]|uniref:hypothetical protein n=1 Tax=Prosthecomicrobium sp. N25 TaxID=3129254 RepID=UPI003076DF94